MAECAKTLGYGGADCPQDSAGMRQVVYMANLDDIATWTATSTGLYSAFTMDAGTGLYRVEIKKDSGIFRETLEGAEEGLGAYNQEYEAMIASLSTTARNFVNDSNGPNIVIIAPQKTDRVLIIGKQNGTKMVENDATSEQDGYGERMLFRASGENEKRNELLDTNYNDTIAFLEGLVIAS